MFHEKLVSGDECDRAPWIFIKKAVFLSLGHVELQILHPEFFPFVMGDVPAFFPFILIAEKNDTGYESSVHVGENVDFWVLGVIGRERGVEPQICHDFGVNVLRILWIVERRIHGSQSADVTARTAATSDHARGVHAKHGGVALEPTDRGCSIGHADSFERCASGQSGFALLVEHLVFGGGAYQTALGEVGAGGAEL